MEPNEESDDRKTKGALIFRAWFWLFVLSSTLTIVIGILCLINYIRHIPESKIEDFIIPYILPAIISGIISYVAISKAENSKYFTDREAKRKESKRTI